MVKIYKIFHPSSDKIYIGKTTNTLTRRLAQHKTDNRKNKRTCWFKSIRKCGLSPFIELIEEVDDSIWQEREKYWINYYRISLGNERVLNHSDGGEIDRTGTRHSDETRNKISISMLGNKPWNKGKELSQETKQKISQSLMGYKIPDNVKEKISNSLKGITPWNKGKNKLSEITIQEIRNKYSTGLFTFKQLAEQYSVDFRTIRNYVTR